MPRILLTGFMGCGKSTVGAHLADLLNRPFVDLDDVVEEMAGCTVARIFASGGEASFRDLEAQALRSVVRSAVCALGGGAVLHRGNLDWARKNAFLVYLKISPEVLRERLAHSRTVRPLLHDANGEPLRGEALMHRITALLNQRESCYSQAHAVIPASDALPEIVARRCAEAYASRKERR